MAGRTDLIGNGPKCLIKPRKNLHDTGQRHGKNGMPLKNGNSQKHAAKRKQANGKHAAGKKAGNHKNGAGRQIKSGHGKGRKKR